MANESRVFRLPAGMSTQVVANAVEAFLSSAKGMEVQSAETTEGYVVQGRQEKDGWKTIAGMRMATTVQMIRMDDNLNVTVGQGEWSDIEIPFTVTSIGEYAFYRCSKLSSMTFSRKTAPSIEENTFSGCSTLNIYVPCDGTGYAGNGWPEDKVKTLHNLDHLDAVPPTCTKDGTKEYWYCPDCGGYFLDKDGEIETDEAGIIWCYSLQSM